MPTDQKGAETADGVPCLGRCNTNVTRRLLPYDSIYYLCTVCVSEDAFTARECVLLFWYSINRGGSEVTQFSNLTASAGSLLS
jgi:hypothetical protein